LAANDFLKKPSINSFEKKEINLLQLKNSANENKAKLIEFNFSTQKQKGDIAATKMKNIF
jgi:tRNA nucleotidyltransferase (CCA-adding enzyme)